MNTVYHYVIDTADDYDVPGKAELGQVFDDCEMAIAFMNSLLISVRQIKRYGKGNFQSINPDLGKYVFTK